MTRGRWLTPEAAARSIIGLLLDCFAAYHLLWVSATGLRSRLSINLWRDYRLASPQTVCCSELRRNCATVRTHAAIFTLPQHLLAHTLRNGGLQTHTAGHTSAPPRLMGADTTVRARRSYRASRAVGNPTRHLRGMRCADIQVCYRGSYAVLCQDLANAMATAQKGSGAVLATARARRTHLYIARCARSQFSAARPHLISRAADSSRCVCAAPPRVDG